jgi:hypothetical protein
MSTTRGGKVQKETLAEVRGLFQDDYLRIRLQEASSVDEALGVLAAAGAAKQISFDPDTLDRLINIFGSPKLPGPTPDEVKWVGGNMRMRDTHGHMSCCTECPSSNGLCC